MKISLKTKLCQENSYRSRELSISAGKNNRHFRAKEASWVLFPTNQITQTKSLDLHEVLLLSFVCSWGMGGILHPPLSLRNHSSSLLCNSKVCYIIDGGCWWVQAAFGGGDLHTWWEGGKPTAGVCLSFTPALLLLGLGWLAPHSFPGPDNCKSDCVQL